MSEVEKLQVSYCRMQLRQEVWNVPSQKKPGCNKSFFRGSDPPTVGRYEHTVGTGLLNGACLSGLLPCTLTSLSGICVTVLNAPPCWRPAPP